MRLVLTTRPAREAFEQIVYCVMTAPGGKTSLFRDDFVTAEPQGHQLHSAAKKKMRVLLTGPSGFLGSAVRRRLLADRQYELRAAYRDAAVFGRDAVGGYELDGTTDWRAALMGCAVIIHTAARVSIVKGEVRDPLAEFRRVNVDGTLRLARQAAASGVKRFIFISTIKVNGEQTAPGACFREDDSPAPEDGYGISKSEAEQSLQQLAQKTGIEVVVIRVPLIYGVGVKGNFAKLCKLIANGLPLPLGSVPNKRSLVGIDNLVDLIIRCIDHPTAANEIFLAGDGEDLSTTELLRGVARAMGRPARLIPVPVGLLQLGATLIGKKAVAQRLLGSLQVDISKTCELLDWKPPYTVEEGLRRCFEPAKENDLFPGAEL